MKLEKEKEKKKSYVLEKKEEQVKVSEPPKLDEKLLQGYNRRSVVVDMIVGS